MKHELPKGVLLRKTRNGVAVLRVHYSADPDRDAAWVARERPKYSTQAGWDKEQEIIHTAGGGELIFAEILNRWGHKIIIRDESFQPAPHWTRWAGFDHGRTNPTAALVTAVDGDGVIYALGEYYQPGLGVHENYANLKRLSGFCEARAILADPSIFYKSQAQLRRDGGSDFVSVADIYASAGLKKLTPGQNAELAGIERILEHWRDLDHREPTLRIVCRSDFTRRQFGLHVNECPALLWELMQARREKSSAARLVNANPTEAVVDKDNHLRDCLKYIIHSLPRPSEMSIEQLREAEIAKACKEGAMQTLGVRMAIFEEHMRQKEEEGKYL